jgi:hypothetical protein
MKTHKTNEPDQSARFENRICKTESVSPGKKILNLLKVSKRAPFAEISEGVLAPWGRTLKPFVSGQKTTAEIRSKY